MRNVLTVLAVSSALAVGAWASDKPVSVQAGEAIPSKIIVTNHLGPFAFTEALVQHLADGTNVVFIGSAVEDPERKPAVVAGFRGAR